MAAPVYESHHFNSKKWGAVKPRPDDIIIATAYKSGTTWMQQIVSELVFQGKEKPGNVGDMSPWVDLRVPPDFVMGPALEAQEHRRFMKTHLPCDAFQPYINKTGKCIYIGRDGRDAFMSLLNHYEKASEVWYGALNGEGLVGPPVPPFSEVAEDVPAWFDKWLTTGWETLPEKDGYPFWSLFKSVKTWWEFGQANPKQVLFVHYNTLLADLPGQVKRIAEFLEIPVDDAKVPDIAKACTFDEMKKVADTLVPAALWKSGGNDFIFKGTNGRWKGVLSDANLEAYNRKVAAELSPECAKWLENGEL